MAHVFAQARIRVRILCELTRRLIVLADRFCDFLSEQPRGRVRRKLYHGRDGVRKLKKKRTARDELHIRNRAVLQQPCVDLLSRRLSPGSSAGARRGGRPTGRRAER